MYSVDGTINRKAGKESYREKTRTKEARNHGSVHMKNLCRNKHLHRSWTPLHQTTATAAPGIISEPSLCLCTTLSKFGDIRGNIQVAEPRSYVSTPVVCTLTRTGLDSEEQEQMPIYLKTSREQKLNNSNLFAH